MIEIIFQANIFNDDDDDDDDDDDYGSQNLFVHQPSFNMLGLK